jgi:hypothetical protein
MQWNIDATSAVICSAVAVMRVILLLRSQEGLASDPGLISAILTAMFRGFNHQFHMDTGGITSVKPRPLS